jgi:hypothetical protein
MLTDIATLDVNSPQQNGDDNPNNANHMEFRDSENGNGFGGSTYVISQLVIL